MPPRTVAKNNALEAPPSKRTKKTPWTQILLPALGVVTTLTFAMLLAVAQTDNSRVKSENIPYAELAKAPSRAAARRNPLQSDRQAVAAGAKLFGQHCAECHGHAGEGGTGSKKGPSLRADEVQQATPGTLFWLLTNGVVRRGMPVWSKLPEPERWQLVSFIKSLTPAKP